MRNRVIDRILEKHFAKKKVLEASISGDGLFVGTLFVDNPCVFPGHTDYREWNGMNYTLRGSGNATQCVKIVKSVMWDAEDKKDRRCGKIHHFQLLFNYLTITITYLSYGFTHFRNPMIHL